MNCRPSAPAVASCLPCSSRASVNCLSRWVLQDRPLPLSGVAFVQRAVTHNDMQVRRSLAVSSRSGVCPVRSCPASECCATPRFFRNGTPVPLTSQTFPAPKLSCLWHPEVFFASKCNETNTMLYAGGLSARTGITKPTITTESKTLHSHEQTC